MTDTTSIDQANATVYQAEQTALTNFANLMTQVNAGLSSINSSLGTGGPQTAARQFLASALASMNSVTSMGNMTNVFAQYGLQSDGTPLSAVVPPTLVTTAPTA